MKNIQITPQNAATVPVRLCLMPDAPDADGAPRAGLLLPTVGRRPVLRVFATIAAALAAKAALEGGR